MEEVCQLLNIPKKINEIWVNFSHFLGNEKGQDEFIDIKKGFEFLKALFN